MRTRALNEKQKRFVAEYLVDLNATQAAIRAGYSQKTAGSIGEENLKKPVISKAIPLPSKTSFDDRRFGQGKSSRSRHL